jgi:hypothetical protein
LVERTPIASDEREPLSGDPRLATGGRDEDLLEARNERRYVVLLGEVFEIERGTAVSPGVER